VNLYVADSTISTVRRIVIATGAVSTLAGTPGTPGWADGIGAGANFSYPFGITTDGTNLYVADTNNSTVRRIEIATRAVTTVAGTVGVPGWADNTGGAAYFDYPQGIATDGTNLYVADTSSSTIRKIIISTRAVNTIAGIALTTGSADGAGAVATFSSPTGIAVRGTNLYVADTNNSTIRKIF
jgi:hypothetical protein